MDVLASRSTERVLNGHRRAANRICWHTTEWNVLISGSQDGTIKLWVCWQTLILALWPLREAYRSFAPRNL